MKGIDWQMVAFVTVSLFQDHWIYSKLPRLYFYENNHPASNDQKH
ncbi:hypothetical protein [Pseudalkalibacillus sp. SCS-8]